MKKYAESLNAPTNVQIEITDSCNAKCKHCYNSGQLEGKTHNDLEKESISEIADIFNKNKIFWTTLTGGEPLLKKELVAYAITELTKKNIIVSLNSNLMLLDKTSADLFKTLGLDGILTSLISYNEDTHDNVTGKKGNFQKVINGIKNAINAGIPSSVSMVLTKYNKNDVYETGKFVRDLGIKKFFVTRGSFPVNMPNFLDIEINSEDIYKGLDELLRVKDDFDMEIVNILECYPLCFLAQNKYYGTFSTRKCSAGITTATIGTDLQLRPCSHSHMKYGNVLDESFSSIRKRMEEWRNGNLLPQKCKECEHLSRCTGGCRMDAHGRGNITNLDYLANDENINKIDELVTKQDKKIKVEPLRGRKLEIIKGLVVREENNGYMIGKGANTVFITKSSIILLNHLLEIKTFKIEDLLEKFEISEKQLNFFLFILIRNKLLFIKD